MPSKQKPENTTRQTDKMVDKSISIMKEIISETHIPKQQVFSLRPECRVSSVIYGESRVPVRAGHLIASRLLNISKENNNLSHDKKNKSYIEVQCAVYESKDQNNKIHRYVLSANTQRNCLKTDIDKVKQNLLNVMRGPAKITETETEILAALQEKRVHLLDASAASYVTDKKEDTLENERMHAEIPFLGKVHQEQLKKVFPDLAGMEMIKIIGTKRPCLCCTAAALITDDARLVSSAYGESIHAGELFCTGDAITGLRHIITQYDYSPDAFEKKMQECIGDQTLVLNRRHEEKSAVTPPLSPRLVPGPAEQRSSAVLRPGGAGSAGTTDSQDETVDAESATAARPRNATQSTQPVSRGRMSARGGQSTNGLFGSRRGGRGR